MSRVVTSADIDALNRVIRQQGIDLQRTNERVTCLEAQVRQLQTPAVSPPAAPFTGLGGAGTPVNGSVGITTPVQPLVTAYGADLHENVITREALMVLGAGQQQPEADKQGGPALNKLVEPSADPYALVAEKVFTDSAPAADAGVSVGGE